MLGLGGRRMHVLALSAAALALVLSGCGDDDTDEAGSPGDQAEQPNDPGPTHVHGLGIDPADGGLFIATHTGLYETPSDESEAARVGDSKQDLMGFSIPAKGRFIASGHPDPADAGSPPNIGLIESRDGGRSWEQISLGGEADFHVLRSAAERVYGFNGLTGTLMVSRDSGESWDEQSPPGPLVDLAIDPADPDHLVAAAVETPDGNDGLYESPNAGASWQPLASGQIGLLAWETSKRLYLVDGAGTVHASTDGGRTFGPRGAIGGQPAAFMAHKNDLYAALPDGTVKASADGGGSWVVRSTP